MAYKAFRETDHGPETQSPREAAKLFFETHTLRRKCSVVQGYEKVYTNGTREWVSPPGSKRWFDVTRQSYERILPE